MSVDDNGGSGRGAATEVFAGEVFAGDGGPRGRAAEPAGGEGLDFRALFEAAPGNYLVLAPDTPHFTMLAASDERLAATLTTREATLGRPLFAIFADANPENPEPSGVANLRASLDIVLRTRAPHRMPVQRYDIQRPDGTWEERHLAPRNVPVLGPGGAVRYLIHHVEDVTERLQEREATATAERLAAALAERERQFRTKLDTLPTLAWTARADGYIDWYNARWYEYTGTTPADMEGWGWQRVHDPATLPTVLGRWTASIATGAPFEMTFPLRGADGVFRDFLTRAAPLRDAAGRVTRWFGTNTDLTPEREAAAERERLLAELVAQNAQLQAQQLELELSNQQLQEQAAELEAQAEELQATAAHLEEQTEAADAARRIAEAERGRAAEANRAKSAFLATMSHELRTPLNAIGGYTQLLELGVHGPVTDDQRAALGRVQGAQTRLLSLINDILNYAKLEGGRVEYDVQAVDVADVVRDVVPLVEPQLRAKGLVFDVRLPEAACVVWADREKLGQVLVNLLSNAVKFTEPRGRVTVSVMLRDGASGDGASGAPGSDGGRPELAFVRVSDTGRGVPRDKQAAIFEPFVQVRARETSYAQATEGTGLGLAISRDLARGMGGDLRVRSREGEGSTFTVTLRRVVDAAGHATDRRTGDERREQERRGAGDRRRDGAGGVEGAGEVDGGRADWDA